MIKQLSIFCAFILVLPSGALAQDQLQKEKGERLEEFKPGEHTSSEIYMRSRAYQLSSMLENNPRMLRLYSEIFGVEKNRLEKRILPTLSNGEDVLESKSSRRKVNQHKIVTKSETFEWDGTNNLGLMNRVFYSDAIGPDSLLWVREYLQGYHNQQIQEQGNFEIRAGSNNRILMQRNLRNLENGKWQNGYSQIYEVNSAGRTTSMESKTLNQGTWEYSNKVSIEYLADGRTDHVISYFHDYGSWQPGFRTTFNYKALNNGNFAYDSTLIESYNSLTGNWENSQLTIAGSTNSTSSDTTYMWNKDTAEWYLSQRSASYYNASGNDTLYITQNYDTSNGSWYNVMREVTTYNSDGNYTEYVVQYYDTTNGNWVNSERTTASWDGNLQATRKEYTWSASDGIWLIYYENEETYNSDNTTDTFTYIWYDSGTFNYGYTEKFEYNSDGDWVTKKSWKLNNDMVKTPHYIRERTFKTEGTGETELLTLEGVSDVANDQGGYVRLELGGLHATSGSIDLNTSDFKVWWYNGSMWENVSTSTYDPSTSNLITVNVPYTLPAGADSSDYLNHFYVTAHTNKGALLSATGFESGVAVDNIAPAKVLNLNISVSGNELDMNWDPNASSDVDGYYLFEHSEEGNYEPENSLSFSKTTSVTTQKPSEKGDYEYVVVAIDEHNNISEPSNTASVTIATGLEVEGGFPDEFSLSQNYPNPFNPTTEIQYSVPEKSVVRVEVFNMLGKKVRTLVNTQKSAGRYSVSFNAENLTSGMYFYRIEANSYSKTQKMMLIK